MRANNEVKWRALAVAAVSLTAAAVFGAGPARAHEVVVEYEVAPSVELRARTGAGEPMAGGLVEVYPPGADSPVTTGVCDDRGRYVFRPDPPVAEGTWLFRVRQGGHAHEVEVPLAGEAATRRGSTRLSPLQYAVMIGCALWGLLATALYVSRRRA
jgi:hypothetical protein